MSPLYRSFLFVLALCVAEASYGYIPSVSRSQHRVTENLITNNNVRHRKLTSLDENVQLPPVLELDPIPLPVLTELSPQSHQRQVQAIARQERKENLFKTTSAALAGFTDVLSLSKYGCILNMVSGNVIKAMTAAANAQWADTFALALFTASYVMGTALFSRIKQWSEALDNSSSMEQLSPLVFVPPMVVVLFGLASVLGRMVATAGTRKLVQAPLLALGFGMVNMATSHASGGTTFFAVTGHFAKVGSAINDFINTGCRAWAPSQVVSDSIRVIFSFMGGAFFGSLWLKLCAKSAISMPCLPATLGIIYAAFFAWHTNPMPLVKRVAFALGKRTAAQRVVPIPPPQFVFTRARQPVAVEIIYPTSYSMHNHTAAAVSA